jgi:hypothetical protein
VFSFELRSLNQENAAAAQPEHFMPVTLTSKLATQLDIKKLAPFGASIFFILK